MPNTIPFKGWGTQGGGQGDGALGRLELPNIGSLKEGFKGTARLGFATEGG
jgi:hypothetical protein